MMIIMIPLDQNLIPKVCIKIKMTTNFKPSTNFLIYLIFEKLVLFSTNLRLSETNQIPLHFEQSQASNRHSPTEYDLRPQLRKSYWFFLRSRSLPDI